MTSLIQLLPDNIANQIAAGEVVQRPASVVKELLENAIDAGAKNIRLIVKDAGKTLVQVIDDGLGMSERDARTAFLRHATSKLRQIEDLFELRTMGFRGEALASIAAVAQVELKTKMREAELGTKLLIQESKVQTQEPCQTPIGTSIEVKNLFYNVPARRNFLRSDTIEFKHIIDEFQRLALAHADISFSLHHNNESIYQLPANNLKQRIIHIFGKKVNKYLVPIKEETDILKIHGFVGKPDYARKTRGEQFFFVNNRFIKSSYLNHAVMAAYEDLLAKSLYPFYLIFLELDPSRLDVNVHPTKQEVKFEDERLVYNYLRVTTRHAIAQVSLTPSIDFEAEKSLNQQFESVWPPKLESETNKPSYPSETKQETYPKQPSSSFRPAQNPQHKRNLENWEELYEGLQTSAENQARPSLGDGSLLPSRLSSQQPSNAIFETNFKSNMGEQGRQLYQLHNSYLISPIKSGFLLIDQRAAHKRILYERYRSKHQQQERLSQKLLFPQTLEFSPSDAVLMKGLLPELQMMGIDLQPADPYRFVLHGLPAEAGRQAEQAFIEGLLERFKQNLDLQLPAQERLLRALAAQTAISKGRSLSNPEMQQMIDELFACEIPYLSPEGQKVFITLELEELEKRFQTQALPSAWSND